MIPVPATYKDCVGVDLPGGGRVHAEGLCPCGGRFDEPLSLSETWQLASAGMIQFVDIDKSHMDDSAASQPDDLLQPLARLTAALDELEAVSGELAAEDVVAAYARRHVSAHSESTYSLSRHAESVRCLECGYAHGRHADTCTVGAAQHFLALIWRKRSAKNTSTKEAKPNERIAQAGVGVRVPGQYHEWIDRRFSCLT